MSLSIKITAGGVEFAGELNESETACAIGKALPIKASGNRWGGEIYFTIPVSVGAEESCRDVLEAGELGYWPVGKAFCIFFGKTPASKDDEIRAASDVNIVGKLMGDLAGLWDVADGAEVTIEKA